MSNVIEQQVFQREGDPMIYLQVMDNGSIMTLSALLWVKVLWGQYILDIAVIQITVLLLSG